MRHSERLAAVGRLAAGIGHELGAPLNVIDVRAEQLLSRPDTPPEKRERNLQIIRTQAARITHIVRQLLNLARPYNLHFAPFAVDNLIKSALEPFENDAENRKIEIVFTAEQDLIVSADRDFLIQVLTNIFQNAVQAMEGAGELRIECKHAESFAVIEISDTGLSIAPENLDRIFDAFFTTKDIGQGIGLGLAVSRRIVEEHGGMIDAANNPQKGASFTIYLPLMQNES